MVRLRPPKPATPSRPTARFSIRPAGNSSSAPTAAATMPANRCPQAKGTLCGIVEYFNGRYRLRITNHEILFDRQ